MNDLLGNWRTSLLGLVAAILNYLVNLGPNLPTTGREWGATLFSAALVGLGIVGKDAAVGSKAPLL